MERKNAFFYGIRDQHVLTPNSSPLQDISNCQRCLKSNLFFHVIPSKSKSLERSTSNIPLMRRSPCSKPINPIPQAPINPTHR